jgi:hypothetical protein
LSRKLWAVVVILVLMSCLLHGCSPSAGEMTPATASRLQSDVDAVVSAVDASRWDGAVDALDQLEADVASAQAAGGLSDERATQIRAVRQRVLEDLQSIRVPSSTPSPTPTNQITPSPESSDNGGTGGDDEGQSGKSEDSGDGEDGNGKNKSKGKGKKG